MCKQQANGFMVMFIPKDHAVKLASRLFKLKRNGAAVSVDFAELGIEPATKSFPFPTLLFDSRTVADFAKQMAKAARKRDNPEDLVSFYIGPKEKDPEARHERLIEKAEKIIAARERARRRAA